MQIVAPPLPAGVGPPKMRSSRSETEEASPGSFSTPQPSASNMNSATVTSTPPPTTTTTLEPSPDAGAPCAVPRGGVSASTHSQESQGRAETAATWRIGKEPNACGDTDDEKISEQVLYIGNLPGARECDDAVIWKRLSQIIKSRVGQHAPIRLDVYECVPHTDGRRWARVVLYRDEDVKTVLSLHDTFLCDRFVKVRQNPDFDIAGIGESPPPYLKNSTVCNNCGEFISQSESETFLASRAWYGAPNVCRHCSDARRVLKNLIQNRQSVYNKSPADIVNHLRKRINHPRHVHRRAYEKVCRYGQFCVRARKGTCWYAHDEFEASIGNVIKFYIQQSHQPVRSTTPSFNPAAAVFTPANRRKETEVRDAVINIPTITQQFRQLDLQREMPSDTLMQLAEECALTYQFVRQELLSRQQVHEAAVAKQGDAGRDVAGVVKVGGEGALPLMAATADFHKVAY